MTSTTNKTMTIFGATGAQGSPVVAETLSKGHNVRAVARDVKKISKAHPEADAYAADLADEQSLIKALDGADAAFLHFPAPQGPDDSANWAKAFFSAAHKVRLPHLVYVTGGPSGDRFPSSVIVDATTQGVKSVLDSGIPSIVLQSAIYLENLQPEIFLPRIRTEGILDYPPVDKDLKVQWISHFDQAKLAAAALTCPDLVGKSFEIGTPGALTGEELSSLIGTWVGRNVNFEPMSPTAFGRRIGETFKSDGTAFALGDLYGSIAQLNDDEMIINTEILEQIFRVRLTPVAEHINAWPKTS